MFWFVGWIFLTVYFLAPPNQAMTWQLDSSNYGSYSWMASHHRQFGTEAIAMTGPLGFLAYGTTYNGDLFGVRFAGDLALKAIFSFLVISLAIPISGLRRWAWLGLMVFFLPNVDDLLYDFIILTAGLWLLVIKPRQGLDLTTLLAAALLGVMGLMKGTNTLVSGVTLGAVVIQALLQRKPGRAAFSAGIAVVVFLIGWIASKQSLGHLPAYFRGVWELASGYNDTMGLSSEPRELKAGLFLAGALTLFFASAAWTVRRDAAGLLTVLFLTGFSFLKWKHGFVRADGHVFIFFNYAVLALPACWLAIAKRDEFESGFSRSMMPLITVGIMIFGSIAANDFRWGRFTEMLTSVPRNFSLHVSYLIAPGKTQRAMQQELAQHRLTADLPQIRAEVGDDSIDFFGYEEGILLLNGLNYQPRPMSGGSFNVFTRYLQEKNSAFLRNPQRRPDFQLVKLQTLDGRLTTADDPLTLNALLYLYTPVRAQRDYLLFRKREIEEAPHPVVLHTVTAQPGEAVAVPGVDDHSLILFSIEAPFSAAGKARGFLFRPPLLEIELLAGEPPKTQTFRLAPTMAAVPVILSPLLENNRDLLSVYGAGIPRRVRQITFHPADASGFAGQFKITFYQLPAPPVPPDDLAPELLTYLQNPLSNRPPLEVTSQETGIHELYEEPITLVHAPGQMSFPRQAGDQQVIFNYGLMPQAYDPGRTKGVEFSVESVGSDGIATVLFSRLLQPVTQPNDRGMQWARVFLPPTISGGSVRLRTNTGPTGDGAWAQSYFAHVQIKSGPPDARQFNGFSAEPLPPGFNSHEELVVYGRKVRSFSPPTAFAFSIPAGSMHVTIAAGIQPSAYTGDNQSNGIDLIVSIQVPGHEPQLLRRRYLNPRERSLDRGTQTFTVALPPGLPADAHLIVRCGPGPNNDDRWDWGYLETVYFSKL